MRIAGYVLVLTSAGLNLGYASAFAAQKTAIAKTVEKESIMGPAAGTGHIASPWLTEAASYRGSPFYTL